MFLGSAGWRVNSENLKGKSGFGTMMTIYVSKSAEIVGDVAIGNGSSVWHGAILRGDLDRIEVGNHTNIQDNGVIHLDLGFPAILGDRVTVGHVAILHGCRVGSDCIIGMGSVISNDSVIGDWSIVAPGAVVPESTKFAEGSVIAGVPAKAIRSVDERLRHRIQVSWQIYHELAKASLPARKELTGDKAKRVSLRVAEEIAKIVRER